MDQRPLAALPFQLLDGCRAFDESMPCPLDGRVEFVVFQRLRGPRVPLGLPLAVVYANRQPAVVGQRATLGNE